MIRTHASSPPRWNARQPSRAFTLVEILIVVVILGILAAIVVPQFTSASQESRKSAMEQSVHRIRQQIEVYAVHHGGIYPTSAATFEDQMTRASNADGATADQGADGFPYGPYLLQVPKNPFTGTRDIGSGALGSSAWHYADGKFRANDSAENAAF